MTLFSRVRILPLAIFGAVLMLSVRLGDIWQGVDGLLSVAPATAQAQQEGEAPPEPAEPPVEEEAVAEEEGEPVEGVGEVVEGAPGDPTTPRTMIGDPTLLTQAEIDLLQQLAERREALDGRERELEQRAGMLDAAEARIAAKLRDLQNLQSTIEGLMVTYDEQQEKKMESLVKIYENMKPKDAARIFGELEIDTLLQVAERMKERKLAPIMAKMDPAKAKDMTVELARLRDLPRAGVE